MTLQPIKMPKLGESVTEGTISRWIVSVGDKVNKYDPLAEVMTDKVNAEIPSSFSGVIKELIAAEGDILAVGETICTIDVFHDDGNMLETGMTTAESVPQSTPIISQTDDKAKKIRYSPAVLKISQEFGIDLSRVQGSGAEGRITRKDLLKLIESGAFPKTGEQNLDSPLNQIGKKEQTGIEKKLPASPSLIASAAGDIEIPLTGIRKAIASKMVQSKHEAPHAWTMIEVDVTNLVQYRNAIKDDFKKTEGFNLTFFAFFVKAVAQVIKEVPQINSMWADDKIIQKKVINISIAVATENALFVPVIRNADEKTIKAIAREISDLAVKARSGKLTPEEMKGGTFTVNNTGSFGSIQSMGIINYPQAAILQVESIVKRPVVVNDNMIAIRDMVNLCLSIDHRVIDGLIAGRFLQRIREILENISKENTQIY